MASHDDNAWVIELKVKLYQRIETFSLLLALLVGTEALVTIDKAIADKILDELRQSLLEFAISDRHHKALFMVAYKILFGCSKESNMTW